MKVYRKYLSDEKIRWAAMKWAQGYSQSEIAKALDVSTVTICNAMKPYRKKKPDLPPLVYDPNWEQGASKLDDYFILAISSEGTVWEKNEGGEVK